MANVMAPLFSMSAHGLFGKTIFFYDTKYGARARRSQGKFTPPGSVWEVNKTWFKMASDRFKTFDSIEKRAWRQAYQTICDTYRDLYMGQQIESWNLSPLNDLTWPSVGIPNLQQPLVLAGRNYKSSGDFSWRYLSWWPVKCYDHSGPTEKIYAYRGYKNELADSIVSVLWYKKLDSDDPPDNDDFLEQHWGLSLTFTKEAGHWTHIWYQFRRWDGTLTNLTHAIKEWWA